MGLTGEVLDRLDAIGELPGGIEAVALRHFADAIGVGLGASTTQAGAHWRSYAASRKERGPASALGVAHGLPAAEAALINGGLIHSLEYDDTHTGSIVHGSAVLAAVALAAGEANGVNGARLTRVYALWYEVFIRMGLAAAGGFQNRGFQLTSIGGAICAAGIASDLKGLNRDQRQAALGIALSQASGVFEFLTNGSTVKSMHPGWAAHAGIMAADLAEAGMTGPLTAIEGRFGLFRQFAGSETAAPAFARMINDIGTVWHLNDAAYKFYPCCHYLHPFIEAAQLLQAKGIGAGDIASVDCGAPQGAAGIVAEPWEAKTLAEGHLARWSLPVTVAMQLVDGKVDLASFEGPLSPGVAELAQRTSWHVLEDSAFPKKFDALLRLTLHDGRVFEQRIDDVYGNGSRPPSTADLDRKFTDNASRLGGSDDVEHLRFVLAGMANASTLDEISTAIRAFGKTKGE